jgi:hypothetical protein
MAVRGFRKRVQRAGFDALRMPARFLERFATPLAVRCSFVFVVGCPHSGTTVVRNYLEKFERIFVVPEETRLFEFPRYRREVVAAVEAWQRQADASGCDHVVEKTPNHIHHLGRIHRWLPEAKVIATMRDPRDVAASLIERNRSLGTAIEKWRTAAEVVARWQDEPWMLTVCYEEFVGDHMSTVDQIGGFLGRCYTGEAPEIVERAAIGSGPGDEFRYDRSNHHIYRAWQAAQPLFDGRNRWQDRLSEQQLDRLATELGSMARHWGYHL